MARKSNPLLKEANVETEYSHAQIIELKKCAVDPIHFIKNYVKIQHPLKGAIKFALYDYQEEMITLYQDNRYTVILSARQTGKCLTQDAVVDVIIPSNNIIINTIKKFILRILDRNLYNEVYQNV